MMGDIGWRRFGAWVVDVVLSGGVMIAVQVPFGWHFRMHYDTAQGWGLLVLNVVVVALYAVPFVVRDGATPGKRLTGIRVAMRDGAGVPGLGTAAVREVVLKVLALGVLNRAVGPALGGLAFALDAGVALFVGVDGLSIHDRLAGTVVVRQGA